MALDIQAASRVVGEVYEQMRSGFVSSDPGVNAILDRIFERPGKGIRPVFMLLISELVHGSWEDLRDSAVIIEAIHIASLIHDDLVDGSPMRRGDATLHTLYSNKTSVLYGDYIFVNALRRSSLLPDQRAVPIIHEAINRMVEGEIGDSLDGRIMDEDTYLNVVSNKTGALFAAAGGLTILAAGGGDRELAWACELGEAVGIAFQISDDLLDFDGDADEMGKPRYMDILSGQYTLPVIHALAGRNRHEVDNLIGEDTATLIHTVRSNGGIEYAYSVAQRYLDCARGIVARFEHPAGQEKFERFLNGIMQRIR